MQPIVYTTGMARVVWAKLISFERLTQIHKNYNDTNIQGLLRVKLKYSEVWRVELVSIAEQ